MARHRAWCFTLNNYADAELSSLRGLATDVSYLILGAEVGEQGTPHIQGFVCLKGPLSFNRFKAKLPPRCHIEPMRGTHQQAAEYCKKDGHFDEYGTLPAPGTRTDLRELVERARACKRLSTIANEFPEMFIRYGRGIQTWATTSELLGEREWRTNVTVICGPPGTGKSRMAFDKGSIIGRIYYKPNGEWWDGYDGQETVIFDDFYGNYPFHDLLKVCDRYPHRVPIKGGFTQFLAKEIFFTSNRIIHSWYNWEKVGEAQALYRRCTTYIWLDANGESDGAAHEETERGVRPTLSY